MSGIKFVIGLIISVMSLVMIVFIKFSERMKWNMPGIIHKNRLEFLVLTAVSCIMGFILMFI